MNKLLIFLMVFSYQIVNAKVNFNADNCKPETQSENKIKMEDLGWKQTLAEMETKFNTVYNEGKRLETRAYQEGDQFVLPTEEGQKIILQEKFILNITSHIEAALRLGYADYIFFSDMGHSHMFIDMAYYKNVIANLDNRDLKSKYEKMFNHKKTMFLYHTAEQLDLKEEDGQPYGDRHSLWRYFSRNLVGDNLQTGRLQVIYSKKHVKNTAHLESYDTSEKYRYWGNGLNISASKDGCFQYINKGKVFNFDISLYDVKYGNTSPQFFDAKTIMDRKNM